MMKSGSDLRELTAMDAGEKQKLLIIDDNIDDFVILKRLISDEYDITYNDGDENIISQLKTLQPSCILLDYNLGAVSGL